MNLTAKLSPRARSLLGASYLAVRFTNKPRHSLRVGGINPDVLHSMRPASETQRVLAEGARAGRLDKAAGQYNRAISTPNPYPPESWQQKTWDEGYDSAGECPKCGGTGSRHGVNGWWPCEACQGKGRVS